MPRGKCKTTSAPTTRTSSKAKPMGSKTRPVAQSLAPGASDAPIVVPDSNSPSPAPGPSSDSVDNATQSLSVPTVPAAASPQGDGCTSNNSKTCEPLPDQDVVRLDQEKSNEHEPISNTFEPPTVKETTSNTPGATARLEANGPEPPIVKETTSDAPGAATRLQSDTSKPPAAEGTTSEPAAVEENMSDTPGATKRLDTGTGNGDPLMRWLISMARTDNNLLNRAAEDLRVSRYCLWIADTKKITANSTWVMGTRPDWATLQWKQDAPDQEDESGGDVLVGFIGMAAVDGSSLNPDIGYQIGWDKDGLSKTKHNFYIVDPARGTGTSLSWWYHQIKGAELIVKSACSERTAAITYLFCNSHLLSLRVRSPLFLPLPTAAKCAERGCPPPEPKADIPKSHRYKTWKFASAEVRKIFNDTIARGYEPQPLKAYHRSHERIHPNAVHDALTGAIVLVYCTLERGYFGKGKSGAAEQQVYANLVKVQVLQSVAPTQSVVVTKRKFAHGYGPDDPSASEGRSSKVPKSVRIAV
ncbi:hypothetical protein FRC12_000131 [Ceratobasidium sp. 428]|nr:hypothetical protein FRC09_020838 [Ceratobasidium sp. 395]KAG8777915.1 hypothetical protein FRC12_000131 [Ceratobasidium sp. 428]